MADKKANKSVKKTPVKKPSSKAINKKKLAPIKEAPVSRGRALINKYPVAKLKNGKLISALVAEFIGTFLFVAFYMGTQGDPRYAMFALIGIALLIGGISGAAVNPAMTISAWVTRKIKMSFAIGCLASQALGAVAAWSILSAFSKSAATSGSMSTVSTFTASEVAAGKEWYVFAAEIIGAFILAFGLAAALKFKKNREPSINSALVYGFALYTAMFITYIMISPLGTGLVFFNPAIAFTTNAIAFKLWPIAIYIIAPIIGGILGFIVQDLIHSQIEVTVVEEK